MKSRSDKYIAPFVCGATGLIAIASPLVIRIPAKMPDYLAKQQILSEQELQRIELAERAKTSEKIKQSGLLIGGNTLTLDNYLDDPKKLPRIRKNILNRYRNQSVWVFDASDKCIGRIINKKFISKHSQPSTCEELPNDR